MTASHRAFLSALLMAVSLSVSAAGEPSDKSSWDKFKAFTHQQKDAAVAEGKRLVAEADKKIDEAKKQASQSAGETKAAHEKNMKELQARKKEAQAHLEKMEKAGSGAWDATKEGFSNAYQELHKAYGKAAAAVKK
jgi:hypothetical protein